MAPTGFYDLVPELRNVIYQDVLPKQAQMNGIHMLDNRCIDDRDVTDITPGIFVTNEPIFSEAITLITGFSFGADRHLHTFLQHLGPSGKHLRHIVCRSFVDVDIFRGIIRMLGQAKYLQKLEIVNALTNSMG